MSAPQLDATTLGDRLGLDDTAAEWLTELAAAGPPDTPVELPTGDAAHAELVRLGLTDQDVAEALAAPPAPDRTPELWWLLERCHQRLVTNMGSTGYFTTWPSLPARLGSTGRYFYVYVFLSALPAVRQFHARRGIPDDVSWDTLRDLGRQVAIHRRTHGIGGLNKHVWLTLHFRGSIYALGRLQFNFEKTYLDADTLRRSNAPFNPGDPVLGVHIPETGPLTPEECAASYAWAREFFPRYFPETTYRYAVCKSWLLDDQLAEYLPESSNIIQFQRGFQVVADSWDGDADIVEFVFRRVAPNLDELPQDTRLQRAVVAHLRAGRHWRVRAGWRPL